MESEALITVLGMALATYVTRAGGFWLMGHITLSRRIERWLRFVPGTLLVAIVAPGIVAGGPAAVGASIATVVVAARTRQLLLAMIAGIALFALLHATLPS